MELENDFIEMNLVLLQKRTEINLCSFFFFRVSDEIMKSKHTDMLSAEQTNVLC